MTSLLRLCRDAIKRMEALKSMIGLQAQVEKKPCQEFVKVDGGLLEQRGFHAIPDKGLKVLAIVGKARMGKSSFLNCIITQASGEAYVFPTQDTDEHCTFGVDAYYIKEKNLVVLDCQGVEHDDSSNDSKLLMFIYLVSDVIIFNERNMLSNATLQSFQSMLVFMSYLELDSIKKPRLVFRISDVDLQLDAETNLEKMLAEKQDQYQNIRESITEMFESPVPVMTAALDRSEKLALKSHEYKKVLANRENGFAAATEKILGLLDRVDLTRSDLWFLSVTKIIDKINANEKIDVKKLDLVEVLAKDQIHEWMSATVDITYYNDIKVDGTQRMYDENVEPRALIKRRILTDFTKRFKGTNEKIKGKYYKDLQTKLGRPIEQAREESEKLGQGILDAAMQTFTGVIPVDYIDAQQANPEANEWYRTMVTKFVALDEKVRGIYYPVCEQYMRWKEEQIEKVKEEFVKEYSGFEAQKLALHWVEQELIGKWINTYRETVTSATGVNKDKLMYDPVKIWYEDIASNIITETVVSIGEYIKSEKLTVKMGQIHLKKDIQLIWVSKKALTHSNLISEMEKLKNSTEFQELYMKYIGKRKQAVCKMFMSMRQFTGENLGIWDKIVKANGDTMEFVSVLHSDTRIPVGKKRKVAWWRKLPYEKELVIPAEVFKKTWKLVVKRALKEMCKRGVVKNMCHGWGYLDMSKIYNGKRLDLCVTQAFASTFNRYFQEELVRWRLGSE